MIYETKKKVNRLQKKTG